MNVEEKLLELVSNELLNGEVCEPSDDLLADGMVDSVGVVRIAIFINEEFGINVLPEHFTLENFQSVAAIAKYVYRHLEQPGRDAA